MVRALHPHIGARLRSWTDLSGVRARVRRQPGAGDAGDARG